MVKLRYNVAPELDDDVRKALVEWVLSLPPAETESMAICVSGVEYTPKQILHEIVRNTDFGKEFVTGLCSLHYWMIESEADSTVVDLIGKSMGPGIQIGEASPPTQGGPDWKEPAVTLYEIGTTAGDIYGALKAKGELSLAELQKEVGGRQPVFNWAIGWLAREGNVAINVERGNVHIRLERRMATRAAGSRAAGD
jgi:hypothetical protein